MLSYEWLLIWAIVWVTSAVVTGDIFASTRRAVEPVPVLGGAVACLLCFVIYVSLAAVGVSTAANPSPIYIFLLQVFGYAGLAWVISELVQMARRVSRLINKLAEYMELEVDRMEAALLNDDD